MPRTPSPGFTKGCADSVLLLLLLAGSLVEQVQILLV